MAPNVKNVAFFKVRTTRSMPARRGPLQCVRNCNKCIIRVDASYQNKIDELAGLKSYDNLVKRKTSWFSQYQNIQYHPGQIDILKVALQTNADQPAVYIVASTQSNDVEFLKQVLEYVNIPCPHHLSQQETSPNGVVETLLTHQAIAISANYRSCVTDDDDNIDKQNSFGLAARDLKNIIESIAQRALDVKNFDPKMVPVVVTKDHNRKQLFGLGSVCINILEPYSLQEYISTLRRDEISAHFTQHVLYDMSMNAAMFPSHLVAFLILHLERYDGVRFEDLVEYVEWFKKTSGESRIQIGFTGDTDNVVKFALVMLKDYLRFGSGYTYHAKNVEKLICYADLVTPLIAYYGLIAHAILVEYNKVETDKKLASFEPGTRVRVVKDDVIETCKTLAGEFERMILCRRPCVTVETNIIDVLHRMVVFDRYFKIEEPKINSAGRRRAHWEGESDDDDYYYQNNRNNPALKTWILVTSRPNRLDRLNLFLHAVSLYA